MYGIMKLLKDIIYSVNCELTYLFLVPGFSYLLQFLNLQNMRRSYRKQLADKMENHGKKRANKVKSWRNLTWLSRTFVLSIKRTSMSSSSFNLYLFTPTIVSVVNGHTTIVRDYNRKTPFPTSLLPDERSSSFPKNKNFKIEYMGKRKPKKLYII